METRQFVNQRQPQTLVIGTMLLYFHAFFGLLIINSALGLAQVAGAVGAYGIANEQKWGYGIGIASALSPFLIRAYAYGNPFSANIITLMFEVALVALLVHPQSREYQRIWFK